MLRALVLAAAVLVAMPGIAAAGDATQVGDFTRVPQEVWTNINRFVFLAALDINVGPGAPEYQRRNALAPSWPNVYAASEQWARTTFPAVQQLAAELGHDDIGSALGRMLDAAKAITPGRGDPSARLDFEAAAKAVEERVTTLSHLTQTTVDQISALDMAVRALRAESLGSRDFALLQIETRAEDAGKALRVATFAWGSLQSDVNALRRTVAAARMIDPDLYAHMSLYRWTAVAKDAQTFVIDMKAQQRYLTGEDYYDACGVKEGQWYTLEGNQRFAVTGDTALPICLAGGPRGRPDPSWEFCTFSHSDDEAWRFRKIAAGWWRIHNKAQGDDLALEAGGVVGFSASANQVGQYWRILPATRRECRMVNSLWGAGLSLDANGDSNHVTLEPTTQTVLQWWTWQEARPGHAVTDARVGTNAFADGVNWHRAASCPAGEHVIDGGSCHCSAGTSAGVIDEHKRWLCKCGEATQPIGAQVAIPNCLADD